jgi:uncharacterized protein (TIGR00369 family)
MSKRIAALEKMIRGEAPAAPVARLIGFRLCSVAHGESLFEMEATEAHWNPMGTLHGGILCDIADAAMGVAFATTLDDGESFTTLELKINFLRPLWKDKLRAVGKVVKRGRSVGMVECEITDSKGSLVAQSSSTCMVLRGEMTQGRSFESAS